MTIPTVEVWSVSVILILIWGEDGAEGGPRTSNISATFEKKGQHSFYARAKEMEEGGEGGDEPKF